MTEEEQGQILNNTEEILRILRNEGSSDSGSSATPSTEFSNELQAKIDEGIPYDELKGFIIEQLALNGIYNEANVLIKIFVHKTGDMILEIKTRPHRNMGKVVDYFYENLGEPSYFETSRYTMRLIMWYRLNKNQQMEDQESDSSIIDAVNDDWGDNDDVNQHIGNG